MPAPAPSGSLSILRPPYRSLALLEAGPWSQILPDPRGSVLVWRIGERLDGHRFELVQTRPGGLPLQVVLPPSGQLSNPDDLLRIVEMARPQSILPHHARSDIADLRNALTRPPSNLAMDVVDYLAWRGLVLDLHTRRVLRRIVELSDELRSVAALARSLYVSRRALGRRFMVRGLPVPSHWLQFCRLLRVAIRLQSEDANLFVIAAGMGYPDGFSLSNQMKRLTGVRPSEVRERLGWEWFMEAWLRREAESGGLAPDWARLFAPAPAPETVRRPKSVRRRSRSAAP